MSVKSIFKEAGKALTGAVLAFVLAIQLLLISTVGAVHAGNKAMGLDKLGITCITAGGVLDTENRSKPDDSHHVSSASSCCTWGSRDALAEFAVVPPNTTCPLFQPTLRAATAIRPANNFLRELPASLRSQQPRAPPVLI
jgi:hypothetical protein